MRYFIGTVTTLACLALVVITAHGSLLGGGAARQAGISIYELHLTHPHMASLPVQEPPLP